MRRVSLLARFLGCCLLFTWAAGPMAAREPGHGASQGASKDDKKKDADHKTGESGGDIPIFEGGPDVAIWTLVVFLLLLFILGRFAWKPMLEGLRKREQSIHDAISEAERAREEAHRFRDQLQQ